MFNSGDWLGNTSSDWHDASNWCGNSVPNSGSSVVIPAGTLNNPVISSGDANVCDISIGGGSELTISNNRTLNVYCSFTNYGNFYSGNNSESVVIKGNPTELTSGNDNFNFLTIDTGAHLVLHDDLNILKNFTNSGTFLQGGNTISFNGTTVQNITSGASSFEDLTINNTSAGSANIILIDDLGIFDHLVLDNGIISTNGNKINFASTAVVTMNSTSSFVMGKMIRSGATTFTFPTGHVNSLDLDGDAVLENYAISAPLEATPEVNATVEVEYFFDNTGMPDWWEHGGNMDATLHHVSNREYWSINSDQNLNNVTLYWNDNAHSNGSICPHGFDFGDPTDFDTDDLSVAFWSGTLWRNAAGTVTGDHDQGFITCPVVPFSGGKGQSFITFGSKDNKNPLPVELLSFTGDCNDGNVKLNWSTASEINNDYFIIEKSNNLKDFTIIAKINGAGNSNNITNYAILDLTNVDMTYYRLVQVDFDGKTEVFPIIAVSCELGIVEPSLTVYPNPFNTELMVVIENLNEESANIQIIDELGQIVYDEKASIDADNALIKLDLGSLKPALYHLRIVSEGHILNKKIIKK
jgi:hypothetical protein